MQNFYHWIQTKSLEETIIEYQNEADKFAIKAEEKKNFELLTMSNSFKRAAKDKHSELLFNFKKACIEEEKKYWVIIDADETELQFRRNWLL